MSNGVRIAIAAVALLCALGFGLTAYSAPEAFPNPNAIYGCAAVCGLIAIACLGGPIGTVVRRVLMGLVCLLYVIYVVREFASPDTQVLTGSRSKPSLVNALAGLLLIGLPCGVYAALGDRLVEWFKRIGAQ